MDYPRRNKKIVYLCKKSYRSKNMNRIVIIILLLMSQAVSVMAQIPSGRSAEVTLLKDFKPVTVVMKNGKINQLRYGNVFLKNSTLVYRKTANSTVMEANMDVVKHIILDKRTFVSLDNQLAEVLDTIAESYLMRVRTIDTETMRAEYLNESNYTNFDLGEVFSFTRSDALEKQEPYPLLDKYYFVIKGKKILAHERNVRNSISRKRLAAYDTMINMGFSWSSIDDLRRMLEFLCEK